MSSSLSQFGINIDEKPQPGPLLKILLQETDQNDKTVVIEEKRLPEKDLNCYLPLLKAALKGNWDSCKSFFDKDPNAVTAKITRASETVLHIVVGTGKSICFVENLLDLIPEKALVNLRDQVGQTALHYAAIFGNVEAAKLLVAKNPCLTNTWNASLLLPLHLAAGYAHKEMVLYLLTVTRDDLKPYAFADESGVKLLNLVIVAQYYGKHSPGPLSLSLFSSLLF